MFYCSFIIFVVQFVFDLRTGNIFSKLFIMFVRIAIMLFVDCIKAVGIQPTRGSRP